MVLKLYGYHISICTRRVACILHEKKAPFEFIPVDITQGEHQTPTYMEKQPFGRVPYIDDDGFILYESRAIARYIAEKYPNQGTKLIPSGIKERALFEQALSIEAANFDQHAGPLIFETIVKKMRGLVPDEAKIEAEKKALEAKLDVYETILSKQEFLAGNELTLADFHHLPYGAWLPAAGCDAIEKRPYVSKWFNDLQNRASWQAVKDGVKSTA